ncbi:MAG: signal peptidase II [Candidatus Melainabacteria bacterium GWA2_34_9]|nr:MAG: signal peptidase II [Candidatus Melainabacteria bacterium GWA2_34_9]
MIKNIINRYYAFLIAIIVLLVDQILKNIIAQNMLLNEKITLLNNILSVTKIYNTGAAFGIFENKTFYLAIFSVFIIISISAYLVRTYKSLNLINTVAWGLVLGGTVGNFIDRLSLGYVLDFIRLDFVNFPIFNVADISINCGAALLIIYILFVSNNNEQKAEIKS